VVGADGVTVGLGVAGAGVAEGVGTTVGGTMEGEAVGPGMLATGVPEAEVLGLAAGPLQAATKTRIRSEATGRRRNMKGTSDGGSIQSFRIDGRRSDDICRISQRQQPTSLNPVRPMRLGAGTAATAPANRGDPISP